MNRNSAVIDHITRGRNRRRKIVSVDSATHWQDGLIGGYSLPNPRAVRQSSKFRVSLASLFLLGITLFLLLRSFNLQVIQGRKHFIFSEINRLRVKRIVPERGIIYDREGEILAKNVPGFSVGIDLSITGDDYLDSTLKRLSEVIKVEYADLENRVQIARSLGQQEALLYRGIDRDTVLIIETSLESLPGVYTEVLPIREYTHGEQLFHVLGFIGEVSPDELGEYASMPLAPGDFVGKSGVERMYEEYLHGTPGKRLIETDVSGRKLSEIATKPPNSGKSVHLAIDLSLQTASFDSLKEMMAESGAVGGVVIVQAVNSGEIISLVSLPALDPNIFSKNISPRDYNVLVDEENQPFFNRAIAANYPPASTYKLVTATAALEDGVVTPTTQIEEVQTINVGGYSYSNWTLLWGIAPHGLLNLTEAIAQSSDIYFYEVGGGYQGIKGVGVERLAYWAREYGFGVPTGIDLSGEVAGTVPDRSFKREIKGENWYLGDTYITAIGQGDVLATPLQINTMTSAIANGGNIYRPFIVKDVVDAEGEISESFTPILVKTVATPETLSLLRQGMREAVEYGTAVELKNHPGRIAGKTGTAEIGSNKEPHAWFTAFAPYESPEIAVTVFVEEGGSGSKVALPVAKKVFDEYFK